MTDRVLLPAFVLLGSTGFISGALALQDTQPIPLLAARMVLASLFSVPIALRRGGFRGAPVLGIAVAGLLFQLVQFAGLYGGLALGVPAALSALVALGLTPVVTVLIAVASGQERLDWGLCAGLAVGILGVAISVAPELGDAEVTAGIGLTLVGVLGIASGAVVQKRYSAGTDPWVSVAIQSLAAMVVMLPVLAVAGGRFDLTPQLALSVLWIAAVMGIGVMLILVQILRRHAATTLTALLLLVPPLTAVVSFFVLGEELHAASLAGMLVGLLGVGAVLRREAA